MLPRKLPCKIAIQTALKLLDRYPIAADMLDATKEEFVETIRFTAHFGEKYALDKYEVTHALLLT